MKLDIKNLFIIFLTALLGASLGTYAIMGIHEEDKPASSLKITQTSYSNEIVGGYTNTVQKTINSVVVVNCKTKMSSTFYGTLEGESQGSGVIISDDGYIITNNHVIENSSSVEVTLSTNETISAKVIGADAKTDLAILKIEKTDLPYATLADSSQLVLGQEVIAIGNPLGLGISVSNGIISALQKEVYINNVYMDLIQTNAAVNEGNSGGGLFDLQGNLVGIVNAKTSSSLSSNVEGMGYAIPSNTIIKVMEDLMNYGYVKNRPTLGVRVYSDSSYYTSNGLLISDVIKDGGADQAGIMAGDVIVGIDDISVNSYADLSKALEDYVIGDQVILHILRNNNKMDFNVTLHEATTN